MNQCLLNNENLCLEAAMCVREHGNKKGETNLNAKLFSQWVNSNLLPSSDLAPNLPWTISVRTAIRWLHHLGFHPQSHKKGVYVDGHEREDVVLHCPEYMGEMKDLCDTHLPRSILQLQAPTTTRCGNKVEASADLP